MTAIPTITTAALITATGHPWSLADAGVGAGAADFAVASVFMAVEDFTAAVDFMGVEAVATVAGIDNLEFY